MSIGTGSAGSTGAARHARSASLFDSPLKVALLAVFLAQILSFPKFVDVWTTGIFHDTDDALRLVQVRDWMAGQGWFDLTVWRMDPPNGVFMHWSRVLDVAIAALIGVFGIFAQAETAERLARLTFPAAMHIGFFLAMIGLGRRLLGEGAVALTALLALFTTATTYQFLPGRLDHHGAQIILLILMISTSLDALKDGSARAGFRAGALAALSLAISAENLPFLVTLAAAFGMMWIVKGPETQKAFSAFGASLAVATALAFLLTVGPQRYSYFEFDSLSTTLLGAATVGGGANVALAALSVRCRSVASRILAATSAVVTMIAIAIAACPAILSDPKRALDAYGMVDPFAREVWLSQVSEAQPLWSLVLMRPRDFLPIALPMLAGLLGIALAIAGDRKARAQWFVVAGFGGVGVLAACWQVRAATSAAPILILGGAWAVMRIAEMTRDASGNIQPLLPLAASLPFVTIFWAQVATIKVSSPATAAVAATPSNSAAISSEACYETASLRALNALPTSLLLNQIDHAGYILAETPHSVIASAYHRNNHGNRIGLNAFLARPDEAHEIARASGARYLVICQPSNEIDSYASRAPQGLAATLARGETPAWLVPVELGTTPYRAYEIR